MELKKKTGESYKEFGHRIYKNRSLHGLENIQAGELMNSEFPDERKGESAHRKYFVAYGEGFDDGYQKALQDHELRETASVSGLNSLIPKTHLERMQELVGDYNVRKRDMQLERNELAKMYRKVTPWILLTEQYRESLREGDIGLPEFNFDRVDTDGEAIVKALPADWHIGVVVDEPYNKYNFEIATRRVDKYCRRVIQEANRFNAKTISITHMGDIIEGIEMRSEQKWDCEFLLADQIKYAQKLFMRMIRTLSESHNVIVSGVYGNHCRLVGDKNKAIGKDNAMKVIMDNIKFAISTAEEITGQKMSRISFAGEQEDYKYVVDEFYGNVCRWQHGHEDAKNDERKMEKYGEVDKEHYNVLGFGHLHHGRVISRNRNNKEIYVPCLQGANPYGKDKVKSTSDSSQSIIVFTEDGGIYPMDINLQNA